MPGQTDPDEPTIDDLIAKVVHEMDVYGPYSEQWPQWMADIERLNKMKTSEPRRRKVNPDVLAGILGNLAGILIIVSYEHMHVMTSKAVAFLGKTNLPNN